MSSIQKESLTEILDAYSTRYGLEESEMIDKTYAFIASTTNWFSKSNLPGQITASAVPYKPESLEILFIWHDKLQRWLQPGGHVEPEDLSLYAAAQRELLEETKIPPASLRMAEKERAIDLDIHAIPARGMHPEHWHYDFRFLFELDPAIDIPVKHSWIGLEELLETSDGSIARYAPKLKEIVPGLRS